jgi:hypothetical protein
MRHIVTSIVAPQSPLYFSTLSHKRCDFRGKELSNVKCVFLFSLQVLSKTFLIVRRIYRNVVKNVQVSKRKLPVIFARILMKFEFSRQIFEKVLNIKFHQNPCIGSQFVPCGRTDMTKLIVAFLNIANAPKNAVFVASLKCIICSGTLQSEGRLLCGKNVRLNQL